MTDKTYTPDDFSRARFAVHPEGGWAARTCRGLLPWSTTEEEGGAGGDFLSDDEMFRDGWRPVVPLPDPDDLDEETLDRAARAACDAWIKGAVGTHGAWLGVVRTVLTALASPPEPTEEERAAEALHPMIQEWMVHRDATGHASLAELLASRGVRVTETKEESR